MTVVGHGVEIVTSSTRPASPFDGMQIYETDTKKVLVYNGSSWVEVNDLDSVGGVSNEVNTARFGSYVWNYWNPTNTSGSNTNAGSTSPDYDIANSTYFTFSNSIGRLTVTLKKAGYYLVTCNVQTRAASLSSYQRVFIDYGGTATLLTEDVVGTRLACCNDSASDNDIDSSMQFIVQATAANQTLTLLPYGSVSSGAGTSFFKFGAGMTIMWLGV